MWLLIVLIIFTVATAYWFWIRPVLKKHPTFADYYAREEGFFSALKLKLSGMKQWLTTVATMSAGFVVTVYDTIISLADQAGFQWGNVQTITSRVPSWAWPIIGMALIGLVQWFREISNRRVAKVMQENGVDPKLALIEPAGLP